MTYILLILAGILTDQFTKYIAALELRAKVQMDLIPGVFSFYYTENTGMAFSMFSDRTMILAMVTVVFMIVLMILLVRNLKRDCVFSKIAMCMMLTGGLSNMIDRIFRGYVIDFLSFDLINFPVFNFADILITIGALLFVFAVIFMDEDIGI